uniref:CSON003278 protein n=2 Tax=Culicoides sonorensis TaxID=179676 RepID=A0A336MPN3_CULSO
MNHMKYLLITIILSVIIYACAARTYHPHSFSFDDKAVVDYSKNEPDLDNSITNDYVTSVNDDIPPPHTEYAKMARYLVHRSDWTSMGTNSLQFPGFPMVNIISIADSPRNEKSTGNVYFYLTDLDFTGQDLAKDNKMTMMLTQDQDMSCRKSNTDSMEPTCARIMLTGSIQKLEPNDKEYVFALNSMVSRHPASKKWVVTHKFYLCKLMIQNIVVLDYYGGPHYVTISDYYNANYDSNMDHVKLIDDGKSTTYKRKTIKTENFEGDDFGEGSDDKTVFIRIHKEIDIIRKRN